MNTRQGLASAMKVIAAYEASGAEIDKDTRKEINRVKNLVREYEATSYISAAQCRKMR